MGLKRLQSKWKQWFIYAARLALASSLAIYAADIFKLQFATQAGVICLFSMLTTSKETLRLSVKRILSFAVTFVAAWIIFQYVSSEWVAFGIFIFVTVVSSEMYGWGAALSMNVVAGCHFLSVDVFSTEIIINELYIVLTGMFFALLFNLFRDTVSAKAGLEENIKEAQVKMQAILGAMADYLDTQGGDKEVWQMLDDLQDYLQVCIVDASDYEGNSFGNDARYYVRYFQMRQAQCMILINLREELRRIKYIPKQSHIIIEYVHYLSAFVTEMSVPHEQIENLKKIVERMKADELPATREEFESRAVLYHVLMDLDDFLNVKRKFIESGDAGHLRFINENTK